MVRVMLRVHQYGDDGPPVVVHDADWRLIQREISPGRYEDLTQSADEVRARAGKVEVLLDGRDPRVVAIFPSLADWEERGAGEQRIFLRLPRWLLQIIDERTPRPVWRGGRQRIIRDLLLTALRDGRGPLEYRLSVPVAGLQVVIRNPEETGWMERILVVEGGSQYREPDMTELREIMERLCHSSWRGEICTAAMPPTTLARVGITDLLFSLCTPKLPRWLVGLLRGAGKRGKRDAFVRGLLVRALYHELCHDACSRSVHLCGG